MDPRLLSHKLMEIQSKYLIIEEVALVILGIRVRVCQRALAQRLEDGVHCTTQVGSTYCETYIPCPSTLWQYVAAQSRQCTGP